MPQQAAGYVELNMKFLIITVIIGIMFLSACGGSQVNSNPTPRPTPSDKFTPADIAKLKWIEGTWRQKEGDKPLYGRYSFEGTTLVVETMEDGSLSKVIDTSRFELKDGRFGKLDGDQLSAASEITDTSVQFVPASGVGNGFRFERQADGTWNAILESPASAGRPATSKVYHMEPWTVTPK